VTTPELSDADVSQLDAWASSHLDEWVEYRRWNIYFERWDWFVHALGEHYRGGVDDYCYNLFVRSLLTPLIESAAPELREKLTVWIAERDHCLLEATEEDVHGVLSRSHVPGPEWWWRRIPTAGDLAVRLRKIAESDEDRRGGSDAP
jgi:hypothetical protein